MTENSTDLADKITDTNSYMFLVNSRIRSYISDQGLKLSEETIEVLNSKIQQILNQAIERTRANKRLTVRPYDL